MSKISESDPQAKPHFMISTYSLSEIRFQQSYFLLSLPSPKNHLAPLNFHLKNALFIDVQILMDLFLLTQTQSHRAGRGSLPLSKDFPDVSYRSESQAAQKVVHIS